MNFTFLLATLENLPPKTRIFLSMGIAGLTFFFLPFSSLDLRLLTTWSSGILSFLALVWLMMLKATPQKTRTLSQRQEANHLAVFLLVIFIIFASLFAIATVLAKNKDSFTPEVGASVVAILTSWFLIHTMFVLHYAAFYYCKDNSSLDGEPLRGLEFSDGVEPRYTDFVYFVFTLGMTSQTSDTSLVSPGMRRLSLGYTIVAFYTYSVIIALTVSIVSGLL